MKHERFELKVRYGLENGGFIPSVTTYIIENSCGTVTCPLSCLYQYLVLLHNHN